MKSPPLTPLLMEAEGGLPAVLDAMRFSADPMIVKFLRVYDATTDQDRDALPWEVWAIKAGLQIEPLLGSIMLALRQHSVNTIKLLTISKHPEVIKARIKSALTPKGYRDRDAIDTALGFLPQQKGATFIGKFYSGMAMPEEDPKPNNPRPDEPDVEDLFPDISNTQFLLTE